MAIQDHTRPQEIIQGHIGPLRPHTAVQYHNVPQKITFCPIVHCFFINFIFTQRNIFCFQCTFFVPFTFFVPLHIVLFPCTFFSILNIFHSSIHASNMNNNNNNNKASFRTFELCSRSKSH